MKLTKAALKRWIKFPIKTPSRSREETVQALADIQLSMENQVISHSQLVVEQDAQSSASLSFRQEEVHLRLKSRTLWLLVEDKNSAFFHRQYRSKLSCHHISEICSSSGEIIKGQLQLQSAANEHF